MNGNRIINLFSYIYTLFRKDIRIKAVIFIIGLILWFNIRLENVFETNINIPIKYFNMKKGHTFLDSPQSFAKIKIRSKGKSLAFMNYTDALYFGIDLESDLKGAAVKLDGDKFNNTTSSDVELVAIHYPIYLDIELDSLVSKRVPIINRCKYETAAGYITTGKFSQIPESLKITGPKEKVDKIGSIFTKSRVDSNLIENYDVKVELNLLDSASINYSAKKVRLYQEIVKKGSNTFKTLIELKNKPLDKQVEIDPIIVDISVEGPVNELQEISDRDFKISVDYRNREENSIEIDVETDIKLKWKISHETVKIIEL